jgi:hypothetical protein
MAQCYPYHTLKDPEDPCHHIYDDCPAGERVIKDGNRRPGENGFPMCKFCKKKKATGKF